MRTACRQRLDVMYFLRRGKPSVSLALFAQRVHPCWKGLKKR
jgi:hypothetical protein